MRTTKIINRSTLRAEKGNSNMALTIPKDERLNEEIRIRVTRTEKNFYESLANSYSFKTGTLLRSILRRSAPDYSKNRFFQ